MLPIQGHKMNLRAVSTTEAEHHGIIISAELTTDRELIAESLRIEKKEEHRPLCFLRNRFFVLLKVCFAILTIEFVDNFARQLSIEHFQDKNMLTEDLPDPEAAPGEDTLYKHFLLHGVIVPKTLTFDEASRCLSNLGKDESGVRYAYLMLSATDMKLTDISKITCFKHVLFVDVSGNYLELEALQVLCEMPYLILLKAERNKITSAGLNPCPYLQVLVLNKNQINETNNITQPYLETLDLSNNIIYEARFQSDNLKELKQLEMVGNQLVELAGDFPVSLEKLYLGHNRIHKIVASDLSKLTNLTVLHLRENKIHKLDGFTKELKNLTYLNLRRNNIKQLRQFRKLRCLPKLETLIITDNPVTTTKAEIVGEHDEEEIEGEEDKKDHIKISILVLLPNLRRINKEVVTLEERDEAFFIAEEKMQEIMEEESSDEESMIITTTEVTTDYTTETETEGGIDPIEYGG